MITTKSLLDAAKLAQGITSEYRLARVLGIGDNTLWNYRHGRTPDDERALKIAALAGLDPRYVLVCLAAERAKDEASRRVLVESAGVLAHALGIPHTAQDLDKMPPPLDGSESAANPVPIGVSGDRVTVDTVYTLGKVSAPSAGAVFAAGWHPVVKKRRALPAIARH